MHRVNILQRVKTDSAWRNIGLKRDHPGCLKWPSGGRFLIEWRNNGIRLSEAAGDTPPDALKAQKRKRLELEIDSSGVKLLDESEPQFPLTTVIAKFVAAEGNAAKHRRRNIFRAAPNWENLAFQIRRVSYPAH